MDEKDPLTDGAEYKRRYVKRIPVISDRIETYLDRDLETTSYPEYFDVLEGQTEFFVKAYPISSITSVKSDSTGEFDGDESDETNYHIGAQENSIVLDTPVIPGRRVLQVVYTGGLATHGVNSVFEITVGSGALVAGKWVEGRTSNAVGYIQSLSGTTLTVEVLYGIFQDGEIIDEKNSESGNANGDYVTINSVTSRGLAEAYPVIVEACELQIRYIDDHRSDFENQSTIKGQTTRRALSDQSPDGLVDEVRNMLRPYKRITVG
jgi:hypothetical protein